MAAARLTVRVVSQEFFRCPRLQTCQSFGVPEVCLLSPSKVEIVPDRRSSYKSSPKEGPPDLYTKYEVLNRPEVWKYVERLLPSKIIPDPIPKDNYPSGWKPQADQATKLPYYVSRTKNHMQPVYLKIDRRGLRRITYVKKIYGDIWALEQELKEYLEKKNKTPVASQVNELYGQIAFKGDHLVLCQQWLDSKGL